MAAGHRAGRSRATPSQRSRSEVSSHDIKQNMCVVSATGSRSAADAPIDVSAVHACRADGVLVGADGGAVVIGDAVDGDGASAARWHGTRCRWVVELGDGCDEAAVAFEKRGLRGVVRFYRLASDGSAAWLGAASGAGAAPSPSEERYAVDGSPALVLLLRASAGNRGFRATVRYSRRRAGAAAAARPWASEPVACAEPSADAAAFALRPPAALGDAPSRVLVAVAAAAGLVAGLLFVVRGCRARRRGHVVRVTEE